MELLMSICVGLGLSAACGFRVFVPMLAIGVAAQSGHLTLSPTWLWLASPAAVTCFATATVLEICGYYIPWVDNLLDAVATPAAIVAGVMASASVVTDTSPLLTWSIAIIGGGGSAAVVQVGTGLTRQASSLTTGGLGNPVLSTLEWMGAGLMSVLALLLPLLAVGLLILCAFAAIRLPGRLRRMRTRQAEA